MDGFRKPVGSGKGRLVDGRRMEKAQYAGWQSLVTQMPGREAVEREGAVGGLVELGGRDEGANNPESGGKKDRKQARQSVPDGFDSLPLF